MLQPFFYCERQHISYCVFQLLIFSVEKGTDVFKFTQGPEMLIVMTEVIEIWVKAQRVKSEEKNSKSEDKFKEITDNDIANKEKLRYLQDKMGRTSLWPKAPVGRYRHWRKGCIFTWPRGAGLLTVGLSDAQGGTEDSKLRAWTSGLKWNQLKFLLRHLLQE